MRHTSAALALFLLLACGPGAEPDPGLDSCAADAHCGLVDGVPTCDAGYVFAAPGDPADRRCVEAGACTPTTCAAEGAACGSLADGCGGTLACGTCTAPETCGGGGTPNACGRPGAGVENTNALCSDGVDNDGDGFTDCRDYDCSRNAAVTVCDTCTPTTCVAEGAECGSLADGCGGTLACGACPTGETCGGAGVPNVCSGPSCTPESDAALCGRYGKDCGAFTAADNCGDTRTVASCGTCTGLTACGAGSPPVENVCGCAPEPADELCLRLDRECDPVTAVDNCGASRNVDCGTCGEGDTCSAEGRCVCVAETDAAFCLRLGAECGEVTDTDDCGDPRTVADCGACVGPEVCNAGLCGLPVQTVATGLQSPAQLQLDTTGIYWTSADAGGTVWMASKTGGQPTVLTTGQVPGSLAVDAGGVYFTTAGMQYAWLYRVARTGGAPALLYEYAPTDMGMGSTIYKEFVNLVSDGTSLYFTVVAKDRMSSGSTYWNATWLGRLNHGATQPAYLHMENQYDYTYTGLTLNAGHAFFRYINGVASKPKSHVFGGYGSWDLVDVVCRDAPSSMVATDSELYLLSGAAVARVPLALDGAGEVVETTSVAVATTAGARNLAHYDGNLYWTGVDADGGYIATVPAAGGTPVKWITHLTSPDAIAVDAARIYWTDYVDGAVYSAQRY